LIAQVATQVSRLALSVILARLLTPSEFGVVAAAMVVMVVCWQLTDLGTQAVIIQRDVIDHALVSSLFWFNLVLGAGLSLITFAGAGLLAEMLGQPHAAPAIRVLAAVSFVGALGNMHHALLRRTMRFGRLATITIANATVNLVLGVALAFAGAGIWALVLGTLAGVAVSTASSWWFERWRPTLTLDLRRLREVARFGIHIFWANALAVVFGQLDKVIISRLLGAAALGTYAVAQRTVLSPVSAVSGTVSTVSLSAFARGQDDVAKLRSGASRAVGLLGLVILPAMIGLATLAEPAVAVVYGPQWDAAVPVMMVLAPIAALQAISCVTASIMQAMGRGDWLYRWALANCLAGAAAMAVGAQWGLVGVSTALALVLCVLGPFEMRMALSLIDMRLSTYLSTLVPHAVATAVMAVAAWLVAAGVERGHGNDLEQLLAGAATGALVYGVLVWRAGVPALADARHIVGRYARRGRDDEPNESGRA
jgi:PST family polysaccharide transporter